MSSERRLSPRKEVILRALIEEYVRAGEQGKPPEPIASRQLSEQLSQVYGVGYSAATVRNELAVLEEEGLIYQPHISAGRAPTDLGYRYFVERLMGESQLPAEEQRQIRHQFYQVQRRLDEWVRLTASVLAQALDSAAVVTPPRSAEGRLKHFEILSLYETVALIVLVLDDGAVRQERIVLDEPRSQDELSRLASVLNARFRLATARTISALADAEDETLPLDARLVVESLTRMLTQSDIFSPDAFYHEGLMRMLQSDEFNHADPERIRNVVEVLERNRYLSAIATQALTRDGVQVIIGGENENEALKDMSLIVSRYGAEGQLGGLVGVVGPTRMQYGRAIAVVRYLTQLLNDLLAETYNS